jgi:hypothetical protein
MRRPRARARAAAAATTATLHSAWAAAPRGARLAATYAACVLRVLRARLRYSRAAMRKPPHAGLYSRQGTLDLY